jgi:hypothetical protein
MKRSYKVSSNVVFASILYTTTTLHTAAAEWRCEADLSRVKTDFCLNQDHEKANLNYSWKLDDDGFALSSRVCMTSGVSAGERLDLVVAIDRSRSVWNSDAPGSKEGSHNIAATRVLIDTLVKEAEGDPARSARFGLIMFSSDPECREFDGSGIAVNRAFPCLYLPAKPLSDSEHVSALKQMLTRAEGKYSQGGLSRGADYSIVTRAVVDNLFAIDARDKTGLILMSDARTWEGSDDDVYAYLKSESYAKAQSSAKQSFDALSRMKVSFVLNPVESVAFGAVHVDAYDNMCALTGADRNDCVSPVVVRNPSTWPANKIDHAAVAAMMISSTTGQVIKLDSAASVTPVLDHMKGSGSSVLPLETASISLDGQTWSAGEIKGDRVRFPSLPAEESLSAQILVKAGGVERKIPIRMSLGKLAPGASELVDQEMLCSLDGSPRLSLKNMQGGSASCGVVAGAKSQNQGTWLLAFAPILLAIMMIFRRRRDAAVVLLAMTGLAGVATQSRAESGLNALQMRPAVDGIGVSERATAMPQGSWHLGLFYDYANDAIELGGEKNVRESSVVDDLSVAHMVAGLGIWRGLSLGLHVPVVLRSDLDRKLGGSSSSETGFTMSDATLSLKYHLTRAFGLDWGVMPILTLPTGKPELMTGDGTVTGGALLVLSDVDGRLSWSANTGWLQRQKALIVEDDRARDLVVRGQFVASGGVAWSVIPEVSVAGNLQFKISAGEGLDLTRSSPAEWMVSTRWKVLVDTGLFAGFGTGLGKGYGSPDYRAVAGVNWTPAARSGRPVATTGSRRATNQP